MQKQATAPKHSRNKLAKGLKTIAAVKTRHKHWMKFSPLPTGCERALHPHPVYTLRLGRFLSGKSVSATLKKVGWMYFLRDRGGKLACAEVSVVSGRHANARFSEGPFVRKALRLIEKAERDPRVARRRIELRSLRLESLHVFCLWLRVARREEYFMPVTTTSEVLRAGEWISRKQLTAALRTEAQRVRAAQECMAHLLEARKASSPVPHPSRTLRRVGFTKALR